MTTYTSTIEIDAPAQIVSGLLLDMPRWTSWTKTVQEATPLRTVVLSPGTRVRVRQPGLPVSVWTVDRADGSALEWNNFRHGLLTVAIHRLQRTATGCRLSVQINQTGFLDAPVRLVYGRLISRHLTQMTADIKAAAESAAATTAPDKSLREQSVNH
jgi:hypothetical protein